MKVIDFKKLVEDNDVEFCFSNGVKFKASDVNYGHVEKLFSGKDDIPVDELFEKLSGAKKGAFKNVPMIELKLAMDEMYKHFFGEKPAS